MLDALTKLACTCRLPLAGTTALYHTSRPAYAPQDGVG